MRKSILSLPQWLGLPAGAALLATSLVWAAPPENKSPKPAKSDVVAVPSDLPSDAVDVTDKVEVTVNGKLRSSSKSSHSVSLTIKNISEDDLQGPLAIMVDGTGIDGLELTQADGKLSDDRAYVIIVKANDELKAGRTLRSQKVNFKSEQLLKPEIRAQFDLKSRVCRVNATEVAADDNQLIEGKSYTQAQFDRTISVQEKWTLPLMKQGKGLVYGTAVGEDADGNLVVRVYTQRSGLDKELPQTLDGIPVQIKTTGEAFSREHPKSALIYENGKPKMSQGGKVQGPPPTEAYTDESGTYHPAFSGPGGDPTIRFARPVPIGVSIANADRLFDADPLPPPVCYSGTLGCRVVDALGTRYMLTNAHVGGGLTLPPEGDPIPIGFITGFPGETIVQPGTSDAGMCGFDLDDPAQLQALLQAIQNNAIGTLVDIESTLTTTLAFIPCNDEDPPLCAPVNLMDASIILIDNNSTSFDTPFGGYDTISRQMSSTPRIGVPVQKYGRTTIYTRGVITGVNVAAAVGNDDDGYGYFTKQMEIVNPNGFTNFGGPGDSGSVIINDTPGKAEDRAPVALLFAGGGNITLANPISVVLARFNLMVDDGNPSTGGLFIGGISGTSGGALAPLKPPSQLR